MTDQARKQGNLWSIILAGGEGERISGFIQRWLGCHRPKQYCTFVGTRSLFQHTLDRVDRLTPPERRVTVVAEAHRREVWSQMAGRPRGKLVLQPANRGTAAGIFLPLTYVRASDPDATVVILPSDHFVHPEERFVELVWRAASVVERLENRLVLLGVPPDRVEVEYGWILPGEDLGRRFGESVRAVQVFLEKPGYAEAEAAMASGALWNTLVLVTKLKTLWNLGWRCFPEVMGLLSRFAEVIGSLQEKDMLQSAYRVMPEQDFSSSLLQRAPDRLAVMPILGVLWSDWGKPERIEDALRRIGKRPNFFLDELPGGEAQPVQPSAVV